MDKEKRILELIDILKAANAAYYQGKEEIMSNFEYDALYDELVSLEAETGIVHADSPTQNVGAEAAVVSKLEKEAHPSKMLSLNKTKEVAELVSFVKGQKAILSWKLDGLTIVLTYRDGKLFKAVTRGNGEIGEVITHNARVFANVPLEIDYKGELVVRGEALITYSDFEKINEEIINIEDRYKNPRNLCSGTVRQLDSKICKRRNVKFYGFSLVGAEGVDFKNSRNEQLGYLEKLGFDVVGRKMVDEETIADAVEEFKHQVAENDFPSDGLVLTLDDIEYGRSLGNTAKFPRDAIAFKWQDEVAKTTLCEVEWSASRTGLLNPVAIFAPVELEGTTVSRASVHNVSIVKELELGIGDEISVYKANMIIPQIAENHTRSGSLEIPKKCPVCGGDTKISSINDALTLICTNEGCPAKKIKQFSLMVSRDALNIDGLSEATLQRFIDMGILHEIKDLFHLDLHKEAIVAEEGFGEKSYENLIKQVEIARKTTATRVLYSLGIPNVGLSTAKNICKFAEDDFDRVRRLTVDELCQVEKVGDVIAEAYVTYFANAENNRVLDDLMKELTLEKESFAVEDNSYEGLTFVITGDVFSFKNRNELKKYIEDRGGKVTGSVTKKTSYLINNDILSGSNKNKTAKELGVPIITEDDFLKL